MTDRQLDDEVQRLTQQVQLAEEVIRAVEDDALPAGAMPAWERYRQRYPRDKP